MRRVRAMRRNRAVRRRGRSGCGVLCLVCWVVAMDWVCACVV